MKSAMRLTALLLTGSLASACASSPTIVGPTAPCTALIPAGWTDPVPSAALPPEASDERDWMVFGVQQTGQLRLANGRTADVLGIVTACEKRDSEAVRQITRPWWRKLWPG